MINIAGQAELFPERTLNFIGKFKKDSIIFDIQSRIISEGIETGPEYNYIIIYNRIFEEDIKSSRVMKYSDYIQKKLEYEDRKLWLASVEKNLGVSYTGLFDGNEIALDIPFKIKSRTFHRVFGGSKIGLRVKGSLSISLIGQKSFTDLPNIDNTSFDFTLDQTQNISIRGKVGTKVDVNIAQNTEQFDFENSLKITYTGESDEIIQKMEAGNIGLTLPGTRFVSFSGVNKGLFGLKTEMKIGKFKSTSIASFERGQKNQIEVKGGVRKQEKIKNARDYEKYRYFYIEDYYRRNMATPENYNNLLEHDDLYSPLYKIKNYSFELYVTRNETGTQYQADIYIDYKAWEDSLTIGSENNLYNENRNVSLIDEDLYEINYELGYIRLKSFYLRSGDILAVRYIKQNISNPDDLEYVGFNDPEDGFDHPFDSLETVSDTKIVLQMLGEYGQDWNDPWNLLEWKNVYSLDGVDISKDEFNLKISKNTAEGIRYEGYNSSDEPKPYLYWYQVNDPETEDEVDLGFLNAANGEFLFPNQKPFWPDDNSLIYSEAGTDSLFIDEQIYTDPSYHGSNFNLEFEFTSKSSSYDLGFNVIEGSEVVRSGATTLKKDIDYIINYNSGQLSIINERYLTADIDILYESASFFQLDQKMLLGNRLEYSFNDDTYIGGTFIYLSESTNEDRVHVGYEPKRNMVFDINGQTKYDLPFLTKAVDKLPLIETDKESKFSIEAEVARIYPNPNPLNAAYIDDFESSKVTTSLGISYGSWHESSYPDDYVTLGNYNLVTEITSDPNLQHIELQYFLKAYSGKDESAFYWYNPTDEDKLTKEAIYKDVPGDEKDDKVNTLDLVLQPSASNPAIVGETYQPEDSWGGIMKYLYSSHQDMRDVKYIEFLVSTNKDISLNIDVGELSEDVIPDGKLNSEDRNNNGVLDILDDSEDTGLDGMRGTADFHKLYHLDTDSVRERESWEFLSYDDHPEESPGNPTPDSKLDHYWQYVKTEKNGLLDTEDLDGGGNLDKTVKAYRYSLDLSANPSEYNDFVVSTEYSSGSNFALYRIPIEDFTSVLNSDPDLSKMKYFKIWVKNATDTIFPTKVRFVSLDLVGNEWAATGENKGKIEAKTVNNQDNKDRYYSPPGVRELDDNGFEKNEQSLCLKITTDTPFGSQLEDEEGRLVFINKILQKGENYLQYKQIKMFLHGGKRVNDPSWDNDRPLYFVYRFGTDSVNFYEYRSKLVNGWKNATVNNQMVIDLNDLTDLKTQKSDAGIRADSLYLVPFKNENINRYIGIKGNPTFQNIKYFNAGALDSALTNLDTEIWMDELRLVKVIKDPGTAARANASLVVADIGSADAQISHQDQDFHRIEQNKGSGVNQTNLNFNSSFNLDKLTPKKLGLKIPLGYSFNKTSSYTKYQGTTDILVDKNDIPDSVRTMSVKNSYDFSINKGSKSNNPFIKYTVDNLSLRGNASFTDKSDPSYIKNYSENYTYNLGYSLSMPGEWFSFRPFGWGENVSFIKKISGVKFTFFPSSYNFNVNTVQSESEKLSRRNNHNRSRSFLVTRKMGTNIKPLPFMDSKYSLSLRSDMYKDREKILSATDSTLVDSVFNNYNKGFGDIFMMDFGELSSLESGLDNKFVLNMGKYLKNNLTFNTSYTWSGDLTGRTPDNNIKNKYDSRFSSKIVTKSIIGDIQKGIEHLFPEEEKKSDDEKSGKEPENKGRGNSGVTGRGGSTKNGKGVMEFLKNNLSDFSFSYSQGRENSFNNIRSFNQANPAFMFAFANRPEDLEYGNTAWSGGWGLKGSTSLGISQNLNLSGISYNFDRSYRSNNNLGFTGNDTQTGFIWPWPNDQEHRKTGANSFIVPVYSLSINGLEKLLKAGESISSISLNHSQSGSESTQWYVDGSEPGLYLTGIPDLSDSELKIRSKKYAVKFNPLVGFSLRLKNGLSFSANFNYSFDMNESYDYSEQQKNITSGEKKYSRDLRVSGSYNQKGGFSIPLDFWPFSGRQLNNDIKYNLSISYSSSNRHKFDIETKEYEGLDNGVLSDNITISPDISYKISSKLNGTLAYSYNYNETRNYDAKSVVNTNHKFELRAVLRITGR